MILLVRHAEPAASPDTPSSTWPLTDAGRAAAETLRASLPPESLLVSSNERKAWETLAGHAADTRVRKDARFDEVYRPNEGWRTDFRDRRRRYVLGDPIAGWETSSAVAQRFDDGIAAVQQQAAGRTVVVGTHGMSMTLWLVHRGLVSSEDAARFWEGLRFPDCWQVSAQQGTVTRWNGLP